MTKKKLSMPHYGASLLATALALSSASALSEINVTQSRYDLYGTGANPQETILNTSNVNVESFGLLYSYDVEGDIYAQPLYVSNLNIPGKGVRNVVYVATMKDVIYAFDADSNTQDGGLLWVKDFRNPKAGITPVPVPGIATNRNIRRDMGIESTPVIDLARQTLYLVARTKEKNDYVQRLHALDLATGEEKPGSPVDIGGSYRGLTFDPRIHNQRASLVLAAGQIIICWGADAGEAALSYHGWIMSYDAATLARTGAFSTTTTVTGGGIWASGRPPAVLAGTDGGQDIVVFTGNATKTNNGHDSVAGNFPESVLRLNVNPARPDNALCLVDWFTPDNWRLLDQHDLDLGGSGPVILPGSEYIVGGGKQGIMYVVDPKDMGHLQEGNPKLVQSFRAVTKLHIMGGGVVWDRSASGQPLLFYNWGESDKLKAWTFDGQKFDLEHMAIGKDYIDGHPGGILTLSSNGVTRGTGIVWSWGSNKGSAIRSVKQGILRAYDAANITRLLWSSRKDVTDDALAFAKFTPPTVANGKVYVATFSGKVLVYGLLPETRARHTYVSLRSRIGNQALEVTGAGREPGTPLQIASITGAARQRWELQTLPSDDNQFISVVNGLYLDDRLPGKTNGLPVQVWSKRLDAKAIAQTWQILPTKNGYVKIVSRGRDRALTLADPNGTPGTAVLTQPQDGSPAQDWKLVVNSDAGVTECNTSAMQFVSALYRNPLLTAAAGNAVEVREPNGSAAQNWSKRILPNGRSAFRSADSGLFLTAADGGAADGDPLSLAPASAAAGQGWEIERIVHPYDTFSYVYPDFDGKTLAVKGGNFRNGTPAVTQTFDQTYKQQWRVQDSDSRWCFP